MWLRRVQIAGITLDITWRSFCLEQVNNKEGPEWKAWERPLEETRGVLALRAGKAAVRQGTELFESFHMALLKARHEAAAQISDRGVLVKVAQETGLDLDTFERNLDDSVMASEVGSDHEAAREKGIFGTPTFVFPGGGTAYLKMLLLPDGADVLGLFRSLENIVEGNPFVGEIKRPQPPWPKNLLTS